MFQISIHHSLACYQSYFNVNKPLFLFYHFLVLLFFFFVCSNDVATFIPGVIESSLHYFFFFSLPSISQAPYHKLLLPFQRRPAFFFLAFFCFSYSCWCSRCLICFFFFHSSFDNLPRGKQREESSRRTKYLYAFRL